MAGMSPRKPSLKRRKAIAPIPTPALDAFARGPVDEQRDALRDAVPSVQELLEDAMFQAVMEKADTGSVDKTPRVGVAMAQVNVGGDGHERTPLYRPVGLGFAECRQFVDQFLPAGLIINRRIRQAMRFMQKPKYDHQPGFQFRFVDESREVREEDKARFAWLRRYLMSGGAEFDPRERRKLQRENLMDFTMQHLRDSLTADHAPIELIPTPSGRIHGFEAVDMERVFLTDPNTGLEGEYAGPALFNVLTGIQVQGSDPRDIVAVYSEDGVIKGHYTHDNILLPVRNKTSDQKYYNYGMAEPDRILRIGSYFLDAMTLNGRSISDNSIPRAVLNLIGDYDQKQVANLRQTINGQGRGAHNRFRLMTLVSPAGEGSGANIIPIGGQVEEALYSRWITLLVAITCGVYLIDPTEIGFESFSAGNYSSLSGSDTEAKLTSSQDAGLYSLMTWYQNTLNEIVQCVDPDVELYLTGLDDNKEDAMQQESNLLTLRHALKRHGLSTEGYTDMMLDAPLNPALMQAYMASAQAQQPQQPGGLPEDPQPGQDDPQEQEGAAQPGTTPEDPEHPTGPDGQARYQDAGGAVWQAHGGQDMAKADGAHQAELWPAPTALIDFEFEGAHD